MRLAWRNARIVAKLDNAGSKKFERALFLFWILGFEFRIIQRDL